MKNTFLYDRTRPIHTKRVPLFKPFLFADEKLNQGFPHVASTGSTTEDSILKLYENIPEISAPFCRLSPAELLALRDSTPNRADFARDANLDMSRISANKDPESDTKVVFETPLSEAQARDVFLLATKKDHHFIGPMTLEMRSSMNRINDIKTNFTKRALQPRDQFIKRKKQDRHLSMSVGLLLPGGPGPSNGLPPGNLKRTLRA